MKKAIKLVRKISYVFFVFILAILLLVNLFILLSGRMYLYKGIANTYLIGKTGPDIYDLDVFPYATIKKNDSSVKWKENTNLSRYVLTTKEQKMHIDTKSTAFLVFKNDELLFENYWKNHQEKTVSNSFSAAKTVVALLVGAAIAEGKIKSIDETVGSYIKEFQTEDKKGITIRHLLQMASGLDWVESGKNPLSTNAESYYGKDLYGLVTRQKGIDRPGKVFNYQSGNSQLLSFVVEKATGKKISVYAQEKLWQKMGAESDAFWSLDKENGAAKAFCCLYATARDFGKLGKLILNRGSWEGRQLIPKEYMDEMLTNKAPKNIHGIENTCYRLHLWTYNDGEDDVFYCRGILGQYIAVIPAKNLVFVRLGHKRIPYMSYDEYLRKKEQGENVKSKDIDHPKDFLAFLKTAKKIGL